MQRRIKMEDLDLQLERQTFNLNYDRWVLIYKDRVLGGLGFANEGGDVELGVDDLGDLDRYMAEQEQNFQEILTGKHTMSGATAPEAPIDWRSNNTEHLKWGAWS
jgi:hypothetical protein